MLAKPSSPMSCEKQAAEERIIDRTYIRIKILNCDIERARRDSNPNLLIRSSMCGHSVLFRSVRHLGLCLCPLFRPVRNLRKSFAPVAPSVAPNSASRGTLLILSPRARRRGTGR
jgi:hypothetical protein